MDNIFVERLWRSRKYGVKERISVPSELAREAEGSAAGRQRRSFTYPQAFLVNLPRRPEAL